MKPSIEHEAALAYAKRGWAVIPLDGKIPFTLHGSKDATKDAALIDSWWTRYPFAAVGIVTGPISGIWVLDADGEEGLKSLKSLGLDKGTPYVRTGGGGIHCFFDWTDGVAQKVRFLPGLDTRAENGYVVGPPSQHKSGKRYEWGGVGKMPTGILSPAPEALLALVRRPDPVQGPVEPPRSLASSGLTPYGRKALDENFKALALAAPGTRDDLRNSLAYSNGRLSAGGHCSREDAIEAIVAACVENGLTADHGEKEIRKRVERAVDDGISAGPRGPAPK